MVTIDAQVHAYERDHPGRPWASVLHGPPEVTGDDMVAAMDAVGVDGALLVSPFSMYRYDASYALAVHAVHPGRFGLIKPVDPADPVVADTIAEWAATKGTVGIRIMLNREGVSTDAADPGINRVLGAAARHAVPVNLMCTGRLEQAGLLAARNPGTSLVIDHLGLPQPHEPAGPRGAIRWSSEAAGFGGARQHRGESIRRLHVVARAFPIPRPVGSALAHFRRVRLRSLHVGDRLDASGRVVDI
jgi:L-fuconolactonase